MSVGCWRSSVVLGEARTDKPSRGRDYPILRNHFDGWGNHHRPRRDHLNRSASPTVGVKLWVVSWQEVADAPEIVHVTAVDEPASRNVNAIEFPVPGAALSVTYMLEIAAAAGAFAVMFASVVDASAPPTGARNVVPAVGRVRADAEYPRTPPPPSRFRPPRSTPVGGRRTDIRPVKWGRWSPRNRSTPGQRFRSSPATRIRWRFRPCQQPIRPLGRR